jgi:hypothetical protein
VKIAKNFSCALIVARLTALSKASPCQAHHR